MKTNPEQNGPEQNNNVSSNSAEWESLSNYAKENKPKNHTAQNVADEYQPRHMDDNEYNPKHISEDEYQPKHAEEGDDEYQPRHFSKDDYIPRHMAEGEYQPKHAKNDTEEHSPKHISEDEYQPKHAEEGDDEYQPRHMPDDEYQPKHIREDESDEEAKKRSEAEDEKRHEEEDEERARGEEEKKKKREEELRKREEEIKEQLRQEYEKLGPLAAINADFTHDRAELARDYAEILLNEEQGKSNLIKRIWKGNLFRKYYQKRYEREILEGKRNVGVDESGKEVGIDTIIESRSGSAIRRFVLGATEDMHYIHEKIGKKDKNGKQDGEKLVEADVETTKIVRTAIENFAKAKVPDDGAIEDIKRNFENELKRLQAEARDKGRSLDKKLVNNYFEVAMQARERAEHGIAMEKVMEGFKVYNADVRNNIRTEAHRDNIDRIVNSLENKGIGVIVPAEVIALAVGSFFSLAQTGARSAAKLVAPVGGIAVSGALAGLRERNRVTEDRARMLRDVAIGLEYDGTSDTETKEHRNKKRAKYEAKIGGTIYDLRSAEELTSGIGKALESKDSQAILRAIAEARVRIDFSDSEQKDLISYSSANKMGDERMELDIAVIRAEKSLSEEDKKKLEAIKTQISKEINRDVDENDNNFKKIRIAQALKRAGKTIALGSAVFFASQEIMAAIDPNKIGLFEKIFKFGNNENAQEETFLASLAGPSVREDVAPPIHGIRGDQQAEIQQYEANGYTKTLVKEAWPETKQKLVDIDPSKSTAQVRVAYDGWANNGTNISDGNELRMYLGNGQISSGMFGTSTMGGQVLDYDAAAVAGKVKGYLTIGGAKFEIASRVNSAGQLTWGENGIFTTTTGETIRAIGANGEKLYKYFEIALDNGTDADGVSHIIPFATDIGTDTFSGKMQQLVDTVIEHPAIYDFTKVTETPLEVFYGGVTGVPPTSRVGLGGPRIPERPSTPQNNPANPPINSGERGGTVNPPSSNPENQPTQNEPVQPAQPEQNPAPSEESGSPEPTSGANTEAAPAPSSGPEQNPEATTDEFTELVRREFGDRIGEDGIEFITSEAPLRELDTARLARLSGWWDGLNDDVKTAIANFVSSGDNNNGNKGDTLREWLEGNPDKIPGSQIG